MKVSHKGRRVKGSREERAVVAMHRELGFKCERTLEGGARSDGSHTYDIDLYARGEDGAALIGECKIKAQGYKTIYDELSINDFLTIRADNKERLYVVPERVWKELIINL